MGLYELADLFLFPFGLCDGMDGMDGVGEFG